MKAIILAAGKGTRLGKYTQNLPKCMLNFGGKTLLERQIETLRGCGINKIIIIRGYFLEKINMPNVKFIEWSGQETNMLADLFEAEKEFDEDILVCYGDIIYEKRILKEILTSESDIGITVDKDYLEYWKARTDNWQDDLESLKIKKDKIVEIGEKVNNVGSTNARYVGIIKLSKKGIEIFREIYHKNKNKYWNSKKPWMNSKSFKQAFMTDLLQSIINEGYNINPIFIKRGWMEFDTVEDYEKALKWLKEGSIKQFINLDK